MSLTIDKQNDGVAYNDLKHQYWNINDNTKYISVTTLIGKFEQPFNKDFWSSYKALEKLLDKDVWKEEKKSLLKTKRFNKEILVAHEIDENLFNKTKEEILVEWEENNRIACERGTKIHSEMEHSFYRDKHNISLSKFEIGGKFECVKGKTDLDLENGIYPEYLISRISSDGKLRIAGQIDLLVIKGNNVIIGDFKGLALDTPIPTINGWSTIAEVKEGDTIFDKNGNPTKILHKSSIHLNPCYKIIFDNGDSITADHEHKWEISFRKNKTKTNPTGMFTTVMTTEELYKYIENIKDDRKSHLIPKILNPEPLNLPKKELLIDPYVLGAWLGDGSKDCGIITQAANSPLWDEIKKRGYEVGDNLQHSEDREGTEMRTVYGLRTLLGKLNLLKNKHIPDEYQRASYEQRLDLLRGLMDTDGYYNDSRKRFVMATGQEWQRDDLVKLLASLGVKTTVFSVTRKCNGKAFKAWDVCFSTSEFNPFLIRNQNIDLHCSRQNNRTFRNIDKIEKVDTVQTQCLEVDSPTHTFLCTEKMIVTHNTNKKIKLKSDYDSNIRSTIKMKYPLNNLDDSNYWHYCMQLSTYAWMIKMKNPNYVIEDLVLIHFDHNDNMTIYHLPYLEKEVIRMLNFYKKEIIKEEQWNRIKPIEY